MLWSCSGPFGRAPVGTIDAGRLDRARCRVHLLQSIFTVGLLLPHSLSTALRGRTSPYPIPITPHPAPCVTTAVRTRATLRARTTTTRTRSARTPSHWRAPRVHTYTRAYPATLPRRTFTPLRCRTRAAAACRRAAFTPYLPHARCTRYQRAYRTRATHTLHAPALLHATAACLRARAFACASNNCRTSAR